MSQIDPLPDQTAPVCIDCDRPEIECSCEDRLRCSCGVPAMVCPCAYGTPTTVTEAMIDRGVFALLAERPPTRPDHAAPILEARREVKAVLRAALDEQRRSSTGDSAS